MGKQHPNIPLYRVDKNLRCLQCGHKGAIQHYGLWHPNGTGNPDYPPSRQNPNQPYMEPILGPGGTIPWECTNCDNRGLEGISMEGYKASFERIETKRMFQ